MRYFTVLLISGALLAAESFNPADVAILGDVDYGKTTDPLECGQAQKFCAVLFNGESGDRVEATITGVEGTPFVAIANGALAEIARGTGRVTATLPEVTGGLATYYIVFRNEHGKAVRFAVQLAKAK